jgi:formyltetrahydrofolate-dependent phosphoribosylglycinamide formyltransferase
VKPLRLGVLISGGGRTLMNIAEAIDRGEIPARIELVISSRHNAAGVENARACGFDVRIAGKKDFSDENAMHEAITAWLREKHIDLVLLAGYLRLFRLTDDFRGRVMNIHPALLPDFGGFGLHGGHVHCAVLQSRRTQSGCTVHFVDDQYDRGPIILQRTCPVLPGDTEATLAARVFDQECIAYPEAIRLFAAGRLRHEHDRVVILPEGFTA